MVDEPRDEELGSNGAEADEPGDNDDSRAPRDTHCEAAYLRELVQSQTPVEVKLRTGETVSGFIEYCDKRFIRLTRQDGPNLFIFKSDILYVSETNAGARPPAGGMRRRS